MKNYTRYISLQTTFLILFVVLLLAQTITGFQSFNTDIIEFNGKPFTFGEYLISGHFLEATFANWESIFLQLAVFVYLTRLYFGPDFSTSTKKGVISNQLKQNLNDNDERRQHIFFSDNNLVAKFFLLFIFAFSLHFYGSLLNYNNEQIFKGKAVISLVGYVTNYRFWFECFRNWQSEFLSLFCIMGIIFYLRKKETEVI